MYDFLDRPVGSLSMGGCIALWAARSWSRALARSSCPVHAIAPAFARCRLVAALQPMHHLMLILRHRSFQTFVVAPVGCPRIGDGEALMLSLLALARTGDHVSLHGLIDSLVEADTAAKAFLAVIAIDRAFADAGLAIGPAQGCAAAA